MQMEQIVIVFHLKIIAYMIVHQTHISTPTTVKGPTLLVYGHFLMSKKHLILLPRRT